MAPEASLWRTPIRKHLPGRKYNGGAVAWPMAAYLIARSFRRRRLAWGAFDTLLGYDFRYLYIGNLLDRVSRANLDRPELLRRWFGGSRPDRADRGE